MTLGHEPPVKDDLTVDYGIVIRLRDERSKDSRLDKIVKIIEVIALPLIIAIITVAAGFITDNVKRIQEENRINLAQTKSVEQLTDRLMNYAHQKEAHDAPVLTVLLGNYGFAGTMVLKALLRLPNKAQVAPDVRQAAADTVVDIILGGKDPDLSKSLTDAQLEILKSKGRFDSSSHVAAADILTRVCGAKNCKDICDLSYSTQQIPNLVDFDGDRQGELVAKIATLKKAHC